MILVVQIDNSILSDFINTKIFFSTCFNDSSVAKRAVIYFVTVALTVAGEMKSGIN